MKKCIIEYKETEYKCYCKELRECKICSTGNNREDSECTVSPNGFCTCRECGVAVRKDRYSYANKDNYTK